MIISSQTGGRLANQLYFVLQAYIIANRDKLDCKYTQIRTIAKQTDMLQYVEKLNISKYYKANEKPTKLLQLNKYYQNIELDFSEQDIRNFINETILQSQFFKNKTIMYDVDNSVAIHIRNGDYLNLPYHNCFDRIEYICNALKRLPKNITNLVIYSDNNDINKKLYDSLFQETGLNIHYNNSIDPLNDLKDLSFYKTKILWNSTFSYWSAFISDCRYNNIDIQTMTICPTKFTEIENAITHCKKEWILI